MNTHKYLSYSNLDLIFNIYNVDDEHIFADLYSQKYMFSIMVNLVEINDFSYEKLQEVLTEVILIKTFVVQLWICNVFVNYECLLRSRKFFICRQLL